MKILQYRAGSLRRLRRLLATVGCFVFAGCGQGAYTAQLQRTLSGAGDTAAFDQALQPAFFDNEFGICFRPPKPLERSALQLPDIKSQWHFTGGTPPLEVLIFGNKSPTGSLDTFLQTCNQTLATVKRAPQSLAQNPDQPTFVANTNYGNVGFQLYTGSGTHPETSTPATWLAYLTEQDGYHLMICFVAPTEVFGQYGEAITLSLRSLALGQNAALAATGTGGSGAAPSSGATGGSATQL